MAGVREAGLVFIPKLLQASPAFYPFLRVGEGGSHYYLRFDLPALSLCGRAHPPPPRRFGCQRQPQMGSPVHASWPNHFHAQQRKQRYSAGCGVGQSGHIRFTYSRSISSNFSNSSNNININSNIFNTKTDIKSSSSSSSSNNNNSLFNNGKSSSANISGNVGAAGTDVSVADRVTAVFLDTETTGLVRLLPRREYPPPRRFLAYDSCRIVSVAMVFVDGELRECARLYRVIKPEPGVDFGDSTKIHNITPELATRHGVEMHSLFDKRLLDLLRQVRFFVGYNVEFDFHALQSELLRRGLAQPAALFDRMKRICVMRQAKDVLELPRNIKLHELHSSLFGTDFVRHNALEDTLAMLRCHRLLNQRSK